MSLVDQTLDRVFYWTLGCGLWPNGQWIELMTEGCRFESQRIECLSKKLDLVSNDIFSGS